MTGTVYTVRIEVRAEHVEGPEPEWPRVAAALAKRAAGGDLILMREGVRSRLTVDAALDVAEDDEL